MLAFPQTYHYEIYNPLSQEKLLQFLIDETKIDLKTQSQSSMNLGILSQLLIATSPLDWEFFHRKFVI